MRDELPRESRMAQRAREREDDRESGRAQRGLFTGRGRRANPEHADARPADERPQHDGRDNERDNGEEHDGRDRGRARDAHDRGEEREEHDDVGWKGQSRPRTGARRSLMGAIRQVPAYIRLMIGLMGDGRVSRIDRFFVIAAAAYMISPLDFIPDIIPFFGEADDIFLVVLALQRLIDNTGRRVLLDHWRGHPDDLSDVSLTRLASAAGFFLPAGIRKRLRRMAHRSA